MEKSRKRFELVLGEMKEAQENGTLSLEKEKEYKTRVLNIVFNNIDSSIPMDEEIGNNKTVASIDPSFFVRKKFLSIP